VDLVALVLPTGGQRCRLLFQACQLLAQRLQALFRGVIAFLGQRRFLDLELDDAAVEVLDLFGLRFHFHADAAGGLVHQVDRLVRQEAVLDITVGKLRGRNQRAVGDVHPVVQLVFFLEPAQDADRVLHARLVDINGLETPLQRGILLDIFLVFVERGCTDTVQLSAAQRRLEQVRGVHRSLAGARPDQRVHLVNEQDNLPVRALDLVEHGLEPFLEFAAILCARDQRTHVEAHQRAPFQAVRHIAIGNAQRQALGDRGLAGAGFADQRGIVLGAAGKDLDRAADFLVAADHRIELAVARCLGQVAGEFLHRIIGAFGIGAVRRLALAQFGNSRLKRLGVDPGRLERLPRPGGACQRQRDQQPLHRDIAVA